MCPSVSSWSSIGQTSPLFPARHLPFKMSDKRMLDEAACAAAWRPCCLAGIGVGRASSWSDLVARNLGRVDGRVTGDSLAFTQAKESPHVQAERGPEAVSY